MYLDVFCFNTRGQDTWRFRWEFSRSKSTGGGTLVIVCSLFLSKNVSTSCIKYMSNADSDVENIASY